MVCKLGCKRIVPAETFHVMEREGPLYEGEIERAAEWAESIIDQLLYHFVECTSFILSLRRTCLRLIKSTLKHGLIQFMDGEENEYQHG